MHADATAPAFPTVPRNTHSPRIASVLPPLAPTPRGIQDATRRLSPRKQSPHRLVPDPPRRRPETQQPSAHMRQPQPVRSDKDECSAVWDEATEAWQITACAALRPTGREQVGHLRACLNRMLQAEQAQRGAGRSSASLDLLQLLDRAPPADLDRQYSALHSIFTAGLHELARQVAIKCVERGELLTSLWTSSEAIKARLLQRKELDVADTRSNLAALEARYAVAEDRLEAMEALETSLGLREEELGRVTASKEKLVSMVKSLQAALQTCEEQLRSTQAARQAAHAQLTQWLPHWQEYTTPAALQLLEAQAAARREVGGGGGATEGVVERAARRREEVRRQAAQLVDWEAPPSIAPEGLSATEVRLLLADAERILGCVLTAAAAAPAAAAPAAASSPDEATADDGAGVAERAALRVALGEAQAHLGEAQESGRQMAEKEAAAQREVGKLQEQVAQLQAQLQAQLSAQVGAPSR